MSTDTEHVDEGTETSVLETWDDWYHIPILGAVMLFMFWVRTQSYERFAMEDGAPALAGVDSWYHWRTVEWTAENYPYTMPYDVFTSFPTGRYVGQFGTLFDQIVVTIAMIVGLGDPSTETLYMVALFTVPAMAALVAIPVFLIGRRLGSTVGGLVGVGILALAPGQFLTRTTVGQLQHHVAEVLFMATAVLALMVALRVAEREMPVYELVANREWDALRAPALYSALAGVALSLYLWVWPPGVVLIGILAAFFTVQLCLDYVRGISPDHVAFVGAISMAVPGVFMLLMLEEVSTSVTSFGILQPAAAFLVAAGCLFMAWLARQWDAREIEPYYYPATIVGLIVVAFAGMWLLLPDLYSTLVGNLTSRLLPLDPGTGTLTIQEAQPPADFTEHVFGEFGAAFYTMLAGLGFLIARPFFGRELRAEHTLIVVWSLFLISMAATQIRFAYYLVLAVAVVNAVFVADVARIFDLDLASSVRSLREIETYQIIVVLMVVMLLFAPLLPPIADDTDTAMAAGENAQPHHSAVAWEDSNHWLAENTPEPGNWAGADNASELDPYGTYDYPEDGDYDYPVGSYGVISWWDYGHLITTQGERIPHSNPFQSGASSSAAFFTAESEERSELVLDAIAAGESPSDATDEELEAMAEGATHEEMRYVMVDDEMASGKFSAMTAFTGPDYSHYTTPEDLEPNEPIDAEEFQDRFEELPYDDTTVSQLYFDDADGMENYRLVHENDEHTSTFVSFGIFDAEADQLLYDEDGNPEVFVNQRLDSQMMGLMQQLTASPQYDIEQLDQREGSAVKTYERVEGATIEGSVGDADLGENATIDATVELDSGVERGTFEYEQSAAVADDGTFELTVPYATDDELDVDDGYTDSSVEAVDDYTVSVDLPTEDNETATQLEATTEVAETAVVEGEETTLEPDDFEEVEVEEPEENGDDENGDENGDEQNGDDENGDDQNGDENGDDQNGDGEDGDEANGDGEDGDETNGVETDDENAAEATDA